MFILPHIPLGDGSPSDPGKARSTVDLADLTLTGWVVTLFAIAATVAGCLVAGRWGYEQGYDFETGWGLCVVGLMAGALTLGLGEGVCNWLGLRILKKR